MNSFDVDEAVGYVNKIIDNVRCATCDRLQGSRLRYHCGHTACDECVIFSEVCQICTSPQRSDSEPKPDYPLTSTVKKATDLLKASQNLINVNAFQQRRVSEQLRIEKELFPKCIQAPIKYANKRKSTNFSVTSKENRYSNYIPGEGVSILGDSKMENSMNSVHQWLNRYEKNLPRKPFSDLNVNTQQNIKPKNKESYKHVTNENASPVVNRKRSHFKTIDRDYSRLGGYRKSVNEFKSTPKKVKRNTSVSHLAQTSSDIQRCDNDESGIFMDNDPIVIDDSQESVIDKDKKAWLAVLKACENEDLTPSTSLVNTSQVTAANDCIEQPKPDVLQINDSHVPRVPFFKRSAIIETCSYCKEEVNSNKLVPVTSPTKPVKISIDSDNFLTTITVFKNVQNDLVMNTSSNVFVQTDDDMCKTNHGDDGLCIKNIDCNKTGKSIVEDLTKDESECSSEKQSIDLFADDRKIIGDICQKPDIDKQVVIEETDSDSDLDISGPMSVKADVHRSCLDIEYGILNEVVNVNDHENRQRRGPRGHTPTSTDSSEKENYNPNRIKRCIAGKKKLRKK